MPALAFTLCVCSLSVRTHQRQSEVGSLGPDKTSGKESGRQQIRGGHVMLMRVITITWWPNKLIASLFTRQSVLNQEVNYIWGRVLHWELTFRFFCFRFILFLLPSSFLFSVGDTKGHTQTQLPACFLISFRRTPLPVTFVFSQEVLSCIISKHHQTRLCATEDFFFLFFSWSFCALKLSPSRQRMFVLP